MRVIISILFFLICFIQVQANYIFVPQDYPTIQAGIDAASEGDTVSVDRGTYTGDGNRDLSFDGVNLVLFARYAKVDCEGDSLNPHFGIKFSNGEDSTSEIVGFVFEGAFAGGGNNGAIIFNGGVANIKNCVIRNNNANGITSVVHGTESRINGCLIKNNRTGIYSYNSNLIIDSCTIQENSLEGIEYDANIKISNSLIAYNGGTGIKHSNGTSAQFEIDHCTIAFNNLGMIYEYVPPMPGVEEIAQQYSNTISNSIVAYNTDGGIFNNFFGDTHYNSVFCDVFGNGNYNWQNDKFSHGDEFGNLSIDPIFCDIETKNLNLQDHSPCRAINNASGSTIGHTENSCGCCVGIRGNVNMDDEQMIDISDLVLMVEYLFICYISICTEEADVTSDGIFDISDLVYFVDFMFMGGPEPLPCYD